jgi:hypothetical protein
LKYLIIFGILTIILYAVLYWRLRPYIKTARRVLGFMREVKRASVSDAAPIQPQSPDTESRLVRCETCGTWTPASRAVKLRSNASYCSHTCLENATAGKARMKG